MAYQHKYKLTISDPYTINTTPEVPYAEEAGTLSTQIGNTVDDDFILRDNHIRFKIEKNTDSAANKATITIYNASKKVSDKLFQFDSVSLVVGLEAGYEDTSTKTIFIGTVTNVSEEFEGHTKETTITLKDGNMNIKETRSLKTYTRGTPVDDILSDMIKEMGLTVDSGKVAKLGDNIFLKSPFMATGSTLSNIERLAWRYKFRFSIQDGKATLMPIDGSVKENVVVISSLKNDGTMIGKPTYYTDNGSNKQDDKEANKKAIQVKTTLNGSVTPEGLVYIESEAFPNGATLKVVKVTHIGSYEGDDWYTEVVGKIVENIVTSGIPYMGGN